MRTIRFINLLFILICTPLPGFAEEFPSDSIYQLNIPLTTQDGRTAPLLNFAKQIRIVTMLYTSCAYVCPMTIQSIKDLEAALPEQERARLKILLVSIDPQRDSVETLAAFAAKHELDLARWSLARATPGDVRKLAAMLGVQYRQLANKEFNHSTVLALISPDGRIVAKANSDDITANFSAMLRQTLAAK